MIVALALSVLLLASAPAAAAAPRLAPEETVFDFGTVERGAMVEHTFRLPNRGDGLLLVDHVKGSCGCTVAVVSAHDVAPGGEARITVTLDTARMAGRTSKVVDVYTNDPAQPVTALAMTGQVEADLIVAPSPLYLGRVRSGEPVRREVLIAPGRAGTAYTVTAVEHASPVLDARLEPRADGPGQRLVVALARHVPLGRLSEQLTLRTTSPREPVMTLTVFGSVEGDVMVLPPQVTFGVTRGDAAPEREVFIRNRGARPVVVTRVAVPAKLVTYELTPVREGVEYRLTLRLRDGLEPGKVEAAVDIFTDHPDEGHLVVPLYAIVRRRG